MKEIYNPLFQSIPTLLINDGKTKQHTITTITDLMFPMQILPLILISDNFFPVNLLALPSSMTKSNREAFDNTIVESR